MEINITPPKTVVVFPERTKTISKVTILELVDNPTKKTVIAKTLENGFITLWENADYDNIGQWTDTDVEDRLKEIYS